MAANPPGAATVSAAADAGLLRALDHALAGEWQKAHAIAQAREGEATADWLHAVVHRIEGDLGNARYWYRQCGRELPATQTVAEELQAIRAAIEGRGARQGGGA